MRLPLLTALLIFSASMLNADYQYPFQNPELPKEERIDDLIGRLTLEEKIACMGSSASVPRLGVEGSPHIEGYHGVAQGGPSNWGHRNPTATTQFPQAYGLGSTWDPALIRRLAAQEGLEARYLYQNAKYDRAGLIIRAPNADIARDPRWGRTEEVFGEDPYHVGILSQAFVEGLQGNDPKYRLTVPLLKHFLANSHENGRASTSSDFDERLWREYYAKPFEMAICESGANALMASYNAVNGTPSHIHPMLREIVMKEWGVDGIICTDGGGMSLLVNGHQAFETMSEAAAACIHSGINHFLDRYDEPLSEAVEKGLVKEADLDEALRGLFRISIDLGLLDPDEQVPYSKIGKEGELEPWKLSETHELVREATRKSIVLLKNEKQLLPLNPEKLEKVAVLGPLCDRVLLDWYSGTPPYTVSPREGIENLSNPNFHGQGLFDVDWVSDMSDTAIEAARKCEVAIVCVGNYPEGNAGWGTVTSPSEGKEDIDREQIILQPEQEAFIQKVYAANPNTVVVLISNFPYAMKWTVENVPSILHMTHASQELGNGLADVLFGRYNPGGKLAQTWPASLEDLPPMMDYNIRNGRTYMYAKAEPQFAFGYGLSYTSFKLESASAPKTLSKHEIATISIDLSNTGSMDGEEVLQIYVSYPNSSVERPRKQLKAFRRIFIEAGKTKLVKMQLKVSDLAYWDVDEPSWKVETGPVDLIIANSSRDIDELAKLRIKVID